MLARPKISGIALGLSLLAFAAVTARPNDGLAAITLTLTGSSGGVYDYALAAAAEEVLRLNPNQTITLSGLSGVTGASVEDNLAPPFTVSSFTSTSVVFVATALFDETNMRAFEIGTLVVDSSVLTTGTVDFSIETGNVGTVSGTVEGPGSAAVPEPGSLTLLGTALAGLGLIRRRRRNLACNSGFADCAPRAA